LLDRETSEEDAFTPAPRLPAPVSAEDYTESGNGTIQPTPPFVPSSTVAVAGPGRGRSREAEEEEVALPYHYLALSTLLLAHSPSIPDAEAVRRLLRDISEVRGAKMRHVVRRVGGGAGVKMSGVAAMEICEGRAFLGLVVDGLRKVGASKEERTREDAEGDGVASDEDEDML